MARREKHSAYIPQLFLSGTAKEFEKMLRRFGEGLVPSSLEISNGDLVVKTGSDGSRLVPVLSRESLFSLMAVSKEGPKRESDVFSENMFRICGVVSYIVSRMGDCSSIPFLSFGPVYEKTILCLSEPVDCRFLDNIDDYDDRELSLLLAFLLSVFRFEHAQERMDIDMDQMMQRIGIVADNGSPYLWDRVTADTLCSLLLTGVDFYDDACDLGSPLSDPVSRMFWNSRMMIRMSSESVERLLPFFLFFSSASEDDLYDLSACYGDWHIIQCKDGLECFQNVLLSVDEAIHLTNCADGMSKKEIRRRLVPLLGLFDNVDESVLAYLPRVVSSDPFSHVDNFVEVSLENMKIVLESVRKSLAENVDEKEAEKRYSALCRHLGNIFSRISDECNGVPSDSHTGKFNVLKLKMAREYVLERPDSAEQVLSFLVPVPSHDSDDHCIDFSIDRILGSMQEKMIGSLVLMSLFHEKMSYADTVSFFILALTSYAQGGKRFLTLEEWEEAAKIVGKCDDILFDWVYQMVVS